MYPVYDYDITSGNESQMVALLDALKPKREWALKSNAWLHGLTSLDQQARHQRCGHYLTMLANEDMSVKKVETAFFCELRLCPGCAWRASLHNATCINAIAQELQSNGRVMLMITLTVPNVPGDMLKDTIRRVNRAWDKLIRRKAYRDAWGDNIRKMEITYNADRDDYHPHLHVVVFVKPSYFMARAGKGTYISQAKLLHDWQDCYECDAITQVHIVRCRDTSGRAQAVLEVAKYAAKASDFCYSEEVFRVYWRATDHMRSITYSGECKALRDAFRRGSLDKWLPTDNTRYVWRLVYQYFEGMGYVHEDTTAYTPPTPAGFGELVGPCTPWDGPTAAQLAQEGGESS